MSHTPKWAVGMQKLAPGIYLDAHNALHLSHREMCEHFGVALTAENSATLEATLREAFREKFPGSAPVPETRLDDDE